MNSNKSLFEYENKILKVKFEEELLDNFSSNLLNCKKFLNCNDIYFYKDEKFFVHNGMCEYYPNLVVIFKNKQLDIFAIDFELDEVDVFYDKNLTDANFDNFIFNGEMIIKAKSFDETDSEKYSINIKIKDMTMQIIVGKSLMTVL